MTGPVVGVRVSGNLTSAISLRGRLDCGSGACLRIVALYLVVYLSCQYDSSGKGSTGVMFKVQKSSMGFLNITTKSKPPGEFCGDRLDLDDDRNDCRSLAFSSM